MVTQIQLPPSERDFQVYQRVILEGVSTRQTAGEFSISQTRIRQLVQRVSRWLADELPAMDEKSDAAHLNLAKHLAADRLQYFYGEAMHGWRNSHESKYAGLVLRVITAQSKLSAIAGTLDALVADAIEGPLPTDESSRHTPSAVPHPPTRRASEGIPDSTTHAPECESPADPSSTPHPAFHTPNSSSPPPRDCSPSPEKTPPVTPSLSVLPNVKPIVESTSTKMPPEVSTTRRAFFAPAQPLPPSGDLPVTQLKITPQELGLGNKKTLSRRERRKLRHAK